MPLLHIFDSSDSRIRQTAAARGAVHRLGLPDGNALAPALDNLVAQGNRFDRVLFETHGSPGRIYFDGNYVGAGYWRSVVARNYARITSPNARVYFNGCNVAEGDAGWRFLEAAAAVFLSPGGGVVFGQTSVGFGNPFNGHVVHLWGSTRTLFVDAHGRVLEHFEQ
jgi:hypothetical protein